MLQMGADLALSKPFFIISPLLFSLTLSGPDEPLKWQYVDQFVSESGVRSRTPVRGVVLGCDWDGNWFGKIGFLSECPSKDP